MNRLNRLVCKQGQRLLENKQQAVMFAVVLALLPYTVWLSVAVMALITLRKGSQAGALLLAFSMVANFLQELTAVSAGIALINTILVYVPCYLAACTLRFTVSWRAVAGVFFLQVLTIVLFVQMVMPEFIMAQFLYFQSIMQELQRDNTLFAIISDRHINQSVLASYLFGIQTVGIVFSAMSSLMVARSVQSQLFYAGEFKKEMLAFRGDKIGLIFLIFLLIAAYYENVLAISLLPMFVLYFLLAGLSLSFNVIAKKRPVSSFVFLMASLVLVPFIMLPVYVIFGSLDSLFNFRSYLYTDAGKF